MAVLCLYWFIKIRCSATFVEYNYILADLICSVPYNIFHLKNFFQKNCKSYLEIFDVGHTFAAASGVSEERKRSSLCYLDLLEKKL